MAALGGYRAEAGQPAVDLIAPSFYSPPTSSCGKKLLHFAHPLLLPYLRTRIFEIQPPSGGLEVTGGVPILRNPSRTTLVYRLIPVGKVVFSTGKD